MGRRAAASINWIWDRLVAQFSAAAVRDPDPWGQKLTILLVPLPALVGLM